MRSKSSSRRTPIGRSQPRKRSGNRPRASAGRYGVSVEWRVEERYGPGGERRRGGRLAKWNRRPGQRPRTSLLQAADHAQISQALNALGHPKRLAILREILAGNDHHRSLSKAVNIKTGPLYFHLRHLERSGLVVIHQRERYEVGPRAMDVLLVMCALFTGRRA